MTGFARVLGFDFEQLELSKLAPVLEDIVACFDEDWVWTWATNSEGCLLPV